MTAGEALLSFVVAAGLLTLAPGLDTALVLRTVLVEGRAAALRATLGIVTGCLVWGAAAAAGLGALLVASPKLFEAIRAAGALYVIWLGLGLLWRAIRPPPPAVLPDGAALAARDWFTRGLLTNMLNPKVGIFYVSFLPQFTPAGVPAGLWMLMLALIHALMGIAWLGLLATGLAGGARGLGGGAARRWLDGATGAAFLAAGGLIVLGRR